MIGKKKMKVRRVKREKMAREKEGDYSLLIASCHMLEKPFYFEKKYSSLIYG